MLLFPCKHIFICQSLFHSLVMFGWLWVIALGCYRFHFYMLYIYLGFSLASYLLYLGLFHHVWTWYVFSIICYTYTDFFGTIDHIAWLLSKLVLSLARHPARLFACWPCYMVSFIQGLLVFSHISALNLFVGTTSNISISNKQFIFLLSSHIVSFLSFKAACCWCFSS